MGTFVDYAYYYNAFYKDKDYKMEAEHVDILLKKYGANINKIIDFGCGTGKHDIELTKLGYHCTGVDLSPLMVEIAKENVKLENLNIDIFTADILSYKPNEKYDAVISLFHVMSYQNKNQDILQAFRTARRALSKGGLFLFDVWYGPGVLSDKPIVRVKEIENEKSILIRIARPLMHNRENVVDVNYEVLVINKETNIVQIIKETHSMRYFFVPEIQLMLEQTGFKMIDNIDCKSLSQTGYDSWTSYFISEAQ